MYKPKIGWVCSTFDLLHPGHILLLEDCKNVCDFLIVGLQEDPTTDRPEKNKPIQSLKERMIQLKAVKYVDKIITYKTEKDLKKLLKKIKPNIRILGSDYKGKHYTGDDLNIEVYYHNRKHKYSSTELRNRIYQIEYKRLYGQ